MDYAEAAMAMREDEPGWQEAVRRIKEAKRSFARELDLSQLGLTEVPDILTTLEDLKTLDLGGNFVSEVPDAHSLWNLIKLKNLVLANNQFAEIPDVIAKLAGLESLDLGYNQLTSFPDVMSQIERLMFLDLSGNQIPSIPDALAQLTRLIRLDLGGNLIKIIPDSLGDLPHLGSLDLSENQIATIPNSIGQLHELTSLFLGKNQLTTIPDCLTQLTHLEIIVLNGNPLPDELLAAAKRGPQILFRYLNALQKFKPRTVKLVLLGEPKSGKTTLLEALKGNLQPCDDARTETIGVDVVTLDRINPVDQEAMHLSVWDFAGQHIEHSTHQFFLTENAVYLILWNARQGHEASKRDLWYWLELLKMRVREPKFLLVATHTKHTPADLNLSDIERAYPGFQGQYPVELEGLAGFAALDERILELAAQSPAMRAEWPADWLPVRDEVRRVREEQPHITPTEFLKLMGRLGVIDPVEQHDLGDQLHHLGEILYFQERAELASLVILDPKWVTELIALVVRSKVVRENHGILRKRDLDALWLEAGLAPEIRKHLINLMDWFDLTYATGHESDIGIVVEALPYSTAENLAQVELPVDRPRMEMIFRFPSLQRRLPPGVPTWGIARAHRFRKGDQWRDLAAFEDPETNSQALIMASDSAKEIRLTVVSDYPPGFYGRMEAILRDTFKRYPGAEPELRVPCPCEAGCGCSYRWETVLTRAKSGKANVTCDHSGEDVAISSLLTGFRPETPEGLLAFRAERRRLFTAEREKMEKTCPSVFTLVPARQFKMLETWMARATREEELELALYCEHDSGWHETAHSLYRFSPDQEWFDELKKGWNGFVGVTKHVATLAKVTGKLSKMAPVEAAGLAAEKLPEAGRSPAGALVRAMGARTEIKAVELETRHLLEKLIAHLDSKRGVAEKKNGGLHKQLIDDGRVLWLCPEHWDLYKGRG
jgi:internalin A